MEHKSRMVLLLLLNILWMIQLALSSRPELSMLKRGGQRTNNCLELRVETVGPYWIEENIEASNVRANLSYGLPLNLTFRVVDGKLSSQNNDCVPISLVRIDLWQARYDGRYSDEAKEKTQGETWLRGYQLTNSTGYVTFNTIYPGWYRSRTVHIHLRIRVYNTDKSVSYEQTTQLFFDDSISDAIFKNVYPYNSRTDTRDTYNEGDSNFHDSNIITLVGDYSDEGGYSGLMEFFVPLASPRNVDEE